jgi:hypothetical protein
MLAQRVSGLQKWGPQLGSQIPIEGQTYSVDQLVAVYTASLNDRSKIASARAALQVLLVQEEKDDAVRTAIDKGVKAALVAKFGSGSQAVLECGYVKAAKKPTVEIKANAVAQAAETRKVLHTMGKAQKKELKKQAAKAAATAAPAPQPAVTAAGTPTKP